MDRVKSFVHDSLTILTTQEIFIPFFLEILKFSVFLLLNTSTHIYIQLIYILQDITIIDLEKLYSLHINLYIYASIDKQIMKYYI